jgi:hypothetical protein
MKGKSPPSVCSRTIFKELSRELYDFGNEIRTGLRAAVDAYCTAQSTDENETIVRLWACALGTLMHDVSGSVLLLLSHGELRAPAMLNRNLFEYQIRLRYYAIRPDKAKLAIDQIPERFKKILRALPPAPGEIEPKDEDDFQQWLNKSDKIERESFRDDVLKTVAPDVYRQAYDGYYGKASGHVHGYEIIIRDIFRDFFHNVADPKIDYKGRLFPANDSAVVCVYNLLEALTEIERLSNITHAHVQLQARWQIIQERYP